MAEELSGVKVVIIVACGALTFILLFIFAKRQIMRFALRSRRGPHFPIGHEAKKSLRRELERRIDIIPSIVYEPRMIEDDDHRFILKPGCEFPPHYFRLKAADDVKLLEQEICRHEKILQRHPSENLRAFLLNTLSVPLNGMGQKLVHQFCDLYEHARYDPNEFGDEEFQAYSKLLLKLIDVAKLLKSYPNSRKSSPNRTPLKQRVQQESKYRTMLDASNLRRGSASLKARDDEILQVVTTHERPTSLSVTTSPVNEENNETSV